MVCPKMLILGAMLEAKFSKTTEIIHDLSHQHLKEIILSTIKIVFTYFLNLLRYNCFQLVGFIISRINYPSQ